MLPLCWDWREAIYTDGACVSGDHGNLLGAAFYDGYTDSLFTVDPCGLGATNTIMRAELGALEQALANSRDVKEHLHVWTDSQASIYMCRRALYYPETLAECKHIDLLNLIVSDFHARAGKGYSTALGKVKSHCGIRGNELADKGAALATDSHCIHDYHVHAPNDSLSTLPAWPVRNDNPDEGPPIAGPSIALSNLGHTVKSITNTALAVGHAKPTVYTALREEANLFSYPDVSNSISQSCPFRAVMTALAVRYNWLWTSARDCLI